LKEFVTACFLSTAKMTVDCVESPSLHFSEEWCLLCQTLLTVTQREAFSRMLADMSKGIEKHSTLQLYAAAPFEAQEP
jgi:hypothetical protein